MDYTIAKYRDPSQPGKWLLTDFTMEQVEGALKDLRELSEKLKADLTAALKAVPNDLRTSGWTVAVHNDYRLNGQPCTFWLLTHPSGRWLKGEGPFDAAALDQIRAVVQEEEERRKPSKGCNLHADCAAAETVAAQEGKPERFGAGSRRLTHCSVEDCEDCFGC